MGNNSGPRPGNLGGQTDKAIRHVKWAQTKATEQGMDMEAPTPRHSWTKVQGGYAGWVERYNARVKAQ